MARLVFAPMAVQDLLRLTDFLAGTSPEWARASAPLILDGLEALKHHPLIGRPVESALRELLISRGRTGYVALYRYNPATDVVLVLGFRHQRERHPR